jgi:peptidoglycan/xylan/chitin deacetylase (PgdA/CDA1 family)
VSARAKVAPVVKGSIKAAAAAADVVRSDVDGITILIYHRVGAGAGGEMDVDPEVFDAHLAWLSTHHRVLSLDDAVDELDRPAGDGDDRSGVVLTFDDGTADWRTHVLPALERHGVPATFYVATDFVEQQVPFPGGGEPISWSALGELAASPLVTIGSHTDRHLLLDRLDDSQVDAELDRSIELLRARIDVDPEHFCYPKAVAGSPAADAAVRRRFRSAVLAGTRPNRAGCDLFRLQRSPVQRSDAMRWFRRKADGGMRLEDDLRRRVNELRYRGATS